MSAYGAWLVIAQEKDHYIVGVYGPFGTREQALEAATRHRADDIQTTAVPLHPTSALGSWS